MKSKFEEKPASLALTEQRNPISEDMDVKSSLEIVEIMNGEDAKISRAVYDAKASIATAIDWVSHAFWKQGRVFYVGAGTSGRLGQLDAAECPPTFGTPPEWVQAVVAGGNKALIQAVEGAEDNEKLGAKDLLKRALTSKDVVIGISSGSTTPYVRGALLVARKKKCKTVLITCTPLPERNSFADLIITLLTGPEVLTGSTRLKAGTATKMVLNMISTGAMIRTGKTYGNLMVDLSCSNQKLIKRGIRIIRDVTLLPDEAARDLLKKADRQVKNAIAMSVLGISAKAAAKLLKDNHGFLRKLFNHPHRKNKKIKAVIFDMDGTILHYGLPNGFSTWAALGWAFGIYSKMEDWVDAYLNGKITYDDIWRVCAESIAGREFAEVRDILFPCAGTPPYSRGFQECAKVLRQHYTTGIVSSGLTIVSEEVQKRLGLDFQLSNSVNVAQGKFDGTFAVQVHFNHKLDALRGKMEAMGIPLSQVCFIGDSPNDIETLKAVGFPVAYNPKTAAVTEAAKGNVIGDFLQLAPLIERF